LAGFSQFVFGVLGAKLGFTFSQGFIDYVLYYSLDTKPWLVMVVGPIFGAIYYGVFYGMIKAFDLKTPGREDSDAVEAAAVITGGTSQDRAVALIRAFGGKKNLKALDACITRLRIELHDVKKLNVERLKAMGASGVLTVGNGVQAIFGPQSENLKGAMEDAIRNRATGIDGEDLPQVAASYSSGAASALSAQKTPSPGLTKNIQPFASSWLDALGGKGNLVEAEPCALTRLRVVLRDRALLNEKALLASGVQAVVRQDAASSKGGTYHLLIGLELGAQADLFEKDWASKTASV
jgi:PTS system glucose-specific IIC component